MTQYKNTVCRGSYLLGSACRHCEKCRDELARIVSDRVPNPAQPSKTINRITRDDVEQFEHRASYPRNLFDQYQTIATKSTIYPGQGTPLGLVYCALKLNGEAGELAEHVGKAMRDDGLCDVTEYEIGDEMGARWQNAYAIFHALKDYRRALIIKEIGDNLWYLSALCKELGITLSEAALGNLEKLCDRGERDALRGSGDDR